jgi:PAS domain S-box-containing protein
MLKNLRLSQQALILILVPLIFEIAFVTALGMQLHQFDQLLQEVNQSRQFGNTLNGFVDDIGQLVKLVDDIKSADNAKEPVSAELLTEIRRRLSVLEDEITNLDKNAPNVEIRQKVVRVSYPVRKVAKIISLGIETYNGGGASALYALIRGQDQLHARKFSHLRNELFASLDGLLSAKHDQQLDFDNKIAQQEVSFRHLILIVAMGAISNVIIALLLWVAFSRGTAESFRVLVDNTRRLALGMPLNPPLQGQGEIAHLDRYFNDMAKALEAARLKERAIIENAIDVICSFDVNHRFTAASSACETLFGWKSDALVGRSLSDVVHSDDLSMMQDFVAKIHHDQHRGQCETRVKRKDGSVVDVLWAMQWSPAEETMYCVAHDITERKEMERMKQEFVAMVSHDLRTPLTSVQACLTLLSTGMYGNLNEQGAENVEMAEANVRRLIALITDLLDMEKMESGKLKMDLTETPMSEIFHRCAGAIVGFGQQQGVKIVIEPTSLTAVSDADRLVQVLVNLVSNAVKFSPPGATVRVVAVEKPDFLEVQVIDQGRGVPAEFREAIFERFQQVEASDAKAKGGSGLGLAICKAIIEGHHGEIGVDSQEGKGSTFWFRIPRASETVHLTTSIADSQP